MLNLLLSSLCTLTPNVAAAPAVASDAAITIVVQDPQPPQQCAFETASTRIYTPENEEWFRKLIDLNPTATVVVVGQGIAVSREGGLVLPQGPMPADVTLSDPV